MFCFRLDKISDGYKGSTKEINKEDCEESTEDSKTKQKHSDEKKDHPQILKYIKNQVDIGYLLVKIVKKFLNISVLMQVLDLLLNLSTCGLLFYSPFYHKCPKKCVKYLCTATLYVQTVQKVSELLDIF